MAEESNAGGGGDASSVKVAVRIRPQLAKEIIDACKICITKTPGEPQTWLGNNKAFTFDYVYDTDSTQEQVYQETVHDLIEGCFEGYNATVLAYGQTGSGKTYTMGTGFELSGAASSNMLSSGGEQIGIIPRAVHQLFKGIATRQEQAKEVGAPPPEFKVTAQFLELYNEDIIDLFDQSTSSHNKMTNSSIHVGGVGKRSSSATTGGIRIHEDVNGNIYTVGVTSKTVQSEDETIQALKSGAFNRTTASTNMNDQSSRSHAIFTLYIQQQRQSKPENPFHLEMEETEKEQINNSSSTGDLETLTAKFHFVDLAGSERLKRTGAVGDRAKEGISINCGLLSLGNVISALGDTSKKASHVPYRDSKLTRMLQDSLGGNSRTQMIACVSPSDRDFMETLNSLKYANRARNIKNKVIANQDRTSRTIAVLRMEIQNLQLELMEYRQGKRVMGEDGTETTNDMYHENAMLTKENSNLRTRIKALQETVDVLTAKNSQLLADKEVGNWIREGGNEANNDISAMVQKYISEVEELRAKLCESENVCEQMRKENTRIKRVSQSFGVSPGPKSSVMGGSPSPWLNNSTSGISPFNAQDTDTGYSVQELIDMAKKDLEKKQEERKRKSSKAEATSPNKAAVDEDKDANSADDEDDESDEETGRDEDQEEESDDTDTESDINKVSEEFNEELVELTSEISLKQKLIEELEMSQRRLHTMKQQYETKLLALQDRIVATQEERDKVLKGMMDSGGGKSSAASQDKVYKIKHDYQEKLEKLQAEVKKLQSAKKEHAKLLRNQSQYERQIDKLKSEVGDMKRTKVKLVQKMKEESNRHREQEVRRTRELSQMKKQTRVNESKIKALESEKRLKENVLRRKTEEVQALRNNQRKMSAMRTQALAAKKNSPMYNKKKFKEAAAKRKWANVEKNITKVALNRQAICQMENDMDRWLKERERLSHKLERMCNKRRRLITEKGDSKLVEDLDDQIENLKTNVAYLHENIVECQQNIVQMEQAENPETDGDGEEAVFKMLNLDDIHIDEAKYLLEKLLAMTISQTCLATQKDGSIKEMENRMTQAMKQNTLHQQLLQHMIEQQDLDIYDLMLENEQGEDESDSDSEDISCASTANGNTAMTNSLRINSNNNHLLVPPSINNLDSVLSADDGVGSDSSMGRREKARRKPTTKEDMLFNDTDFDQQPYSLPSQLPAQSPSRMPPPHPMITGPSLIKPPSSANNSSRIPFQRSLSFTKDPNSDLMTRSRSFTRPPSNNVRNGIRIPGANNRYPNIPTFNRNNENGNGHHSGIPDIMTQSVNESIISRLAPVYQPSPVFSRRSAERASFTSSRSSMRRYNSAAKLDAESNVTPPGSPPSYRRNNSNDTSASGKNVFHRLVAGTTIGESSKLPDKGQINPFQGRIAPKSPLICVNVAEGHTKSVLSVFATDEWLFSASKDRTVKVWDLCRKEEVQSLGGHPNNVVSVKYSEQTRLAFTVSSAFVKVWDLRMNTSGSNNGCIKTLSSSGLTTNGPVQQLPGASSGIRTLAMPPGETAINDIALTDSGYGLFSAAADKVRIWDLRKFHSIGKLSGGHQAAVMCLTTGPLTRYGNEQMSDNVDFGENEREYYVITGSKDHYIKIFNVTDGRGGVVAPSTNLDPPHYDGIECLALRGDKLFSASRDTCIKKWNVRTGELVRSINNAHKDWICGLAFLPGGHTIVSGCRAGYLKLWSSESCMPVGEMKAHNTTINTIATNNIHVFTGSNDGSIGMWKIRNQENCDKSPDTSESS